jgi:hypothetical protein
MDGIAGRNDPWKTEAGDVSRTEPEARLVDLVMAVVDDDQTLDEDSRPLLLSVLTGDEELEAGLAGGTRASTRPATSDNDASPAAGRVPEVDQRGQVPRDRS